MTDGDPSLLDWRELARMISEGVAVQDGDSFVFVSETFASVADGEPAALTGSSWRLLFDEGEADRLEREALARVSENGR
jgi:hypothetical protein